MDKKTKFKIADRNKADIIRSAERIFTLLSSDLADLQKQAQEMRDEKHRIIREQRYEDAAHLRVKEKALLDIISARDSVDISQEIIDLLEDCIFFEFRPTIVRELCELMITKFEEIKSKKPKECTANERKLRKIGGLARMLMEFTPYKFYFLGGAMGQHRTLYARDHREAWDKAHEYCNESLSGHVRGIFALTEDGKDVGTLKNLEAMFAPIPEDPKEIRSVRAVDLLPEYKDYK